ncbi:MAG TPA: hypothetical protein VJA94_17995 [Candidatus Angelobacter sp.]
MPKTSSEIIEEAIRRPRRYWDADGIPEIAIGAFWLLWGVIVLAPLAVPALSNWKNLIALMGILPAPWLMEAAVKKWKERITFPRTGYVKLAPPSGSLRLMLVAFAAGLGVAAMLVTRFKTLVSGDWMAAVLGVVISLTLLQLAWRIHSMRLALLSCAVAGIGIAASILAVSHDTSTILVFFGAGLVCVLDGVLRMRSYVRSHPLPAGEQL